MSREKEIFIKLKNCYLIKQKFLIDKAGPYMVTAVDDNIDSIKIVTYSHTELFNALLKLQKECTLIHFRTEALGVFVRDMERQYGLYWNLEYHSSFWTTEEFFRLNEVTFINEP